MESNKNDLKVKRKKNELVFRYVRRIIFFYFIRGKKINKWNPVCIGVYDKNYGKLGGNRIVDVKRQLSKTSSFKFLLLLSISNWHFIFYSLRQFFFQILFTVLHINKAYKFNLKNFPKKKKKKKKT